MLKYGEGESILLTFLVFLSMSAIQPVDDPFVIAEPDPTSQAEEIAPARAPQAASPPAATSPQRLICRSRPLLGSRVVAQRICKTAEDWALYENDLEASRRDIADRGARGCDMRYQKEC